jgi:GNAT superfamily N-acetyltransferase
MENIESDPKQKDTMLQAPVPLTGDHDLDQFDCGDMALNSWLKSRALHNEGRFSRTYVVCNQDRVVAFFCITSGSVERTTAPGKLRRNAPDTIPVSVIGRLAVCRSHARRGLGADILSDALRRIAVASQSIGIAAVLVHAKDDVAKKFYLSRAEFVEYPENSRILYLPIETVIAAFS